MFGNKPKASALESLETIMESKRESMIDNSRTISMLESKARESEVPNQKDKMVSPKATNKNKPTPGAGAQNEKYNEFMKFMEGIEEEISSQCERSAQRINKDKQELDDIFVGSVPSYDQGAREGSPMAPEGDHEDASKKALSRIDAIDSTSSMIHKKDDPVVY